MVKIIVNKRYCSKCKNETAFNKLENGVCLDCIKPLILPDVLQDIVMDYSKPVKHEQFIKFVNILKEQFIDYDEDKLLEFLEYDLEYAEYHYDWLIDGFDDDYEKTNHLHYILNDVESVYEGLEDHMKEQYRIHDRSDVRFGWSANLPAILDDWFKSNMAYIENSLMDLQFEEVLDFLKIKYEDDKEVYEKYFKGLMLRYIIENDVEFGGMEADHYISVFLEYAEDTDYHADFLELIEKYNSDYEESDEDSDSD